MSTEVENEDLIPEIGNEQLQTYAIKQLSTLGGCVTYGPFKICADITSDPLSAEVIVSYNGSQVGKCVVNAAHPECRVTYGNSLVKLDVKIKLDISGKKITAEGKVCVHVPVVGWQCVSKTVTVYSW